jgi:circadian clock protein KaiB
MAEGIMEADRAAKKGSKGTWDLCLYVMNRSQKSVAAFTNLKKLCEQKLVGRYRIEVVDIARHPEQARTAHIVAVPALVRRRPLPVRTCIGDLSDLDAVLAGLDLLRS